MLATDFKKLTHIVLSYLKLKPVRHGAGHFPRLGDTIYEAITFVKRGIPMVV